jgi:hypothetical protein
MNTTTRARRPRRDRWQTRRAPSGLPGKAGEPHSASSVMLPLAAGLHHSKEAK